MASNNKPYHEQPHLHTRAEHRAAVLTYPGNFREALRQGQADPKKTLFGVAHGIASVAVTKVENQTNMCQVSSANVVLFRSSPQPSPTSSGSTTSTPCSTALLSMSKKQHHFYKMSRSLT
jgi:hypothetical protein